LEPIARTAISPPGLFCAGLFCAGLFCAGLFCAGLFCAGLFCAGLFCAGLFCAGLFCAGVQGERKMCLLCSPASGDQVLARRNHVLQLLALLEHPDALPLDTALHVAQEILVLAQADTAAFRCEPVFPPRAATMDAAAMDTIDGRLS
jgi:hypothetical protein